MIEAIDRIERHASRGRDTFDRDELIQSWIARHLQILGEAAGAMPSEIRQEAPDVECQTPCNLSLRRLVTFRLAEA
jgi:uncharacterized protein with HEPN domain